MGLVINDLISFFLLVVFGFVLTKIKVANQKWLEVFNQYSFNIGLPFLTFNAINQSQINWLIFKNLLYYNLLILLTISVIAIFFFKYILKKYLYGGTWLFAILYGNVAFVGIPLLKSLFNDESLPVLIASIHLFFVMLIGLIVSVKLEKNGVENIKVDYRFFYQNPIIWSIFIGFIINMFYATFQPVVSLPLFKMLSSTATPIILISLGIFTQLNLKLIFNYWKEALLYSLIKLLIIPLILYYFSFHIFSPKILNIQILQFAMPSALASFVLALKYQLNAKMLASFIILSTILFLIVFPFLITVVV